VDPTSLAGRHHRTCAARPAGAEPLSDDDTAELHESQAEFGGRLDDRDHDR
jgi:hypothetical protein